MKKICLYCVTLSIIIFAGKLVQAENLPIESVRFVDGTITVSGTSAQREPITVEVLKEGKTWEEVDSPNSFENIMNYLTYFDQITSFDENNKYSLTVNGYTGNAEPEIRVLYNDEFFYYSPKTLTEINASKSAEELINAIRANAYLKQAAENELSGLTKTEAQNSFLNSFFAEKEKLRAANGKGFTGMGEIVECVAGLVRIKNVCYATDDEMSAALELFAAYGISESDSYDIYKNSGDFSKENYMTPAQKAELHKNLRTKAETESNPRSFADYFSEQTVLTACRGSLSKHLVRDIIEKSDILAKEDIQEYLKLDVTDRLKVCSSINEASSPYESISALASAIRSFSKTLSGKTSSGSSGSGSSGGGKNSYAVSVSSGTRENNDEKDTFTDIKDCDWAKTAIEQLCKRGIVNGRESGKFEPNEYVRREEFTKMLVVALDIYDRNAQADFNDVPSDAWYAAYVASAKNAGLISGISESEFGAGNKITREQMAVMLNRAAEKLISEETADAIGDYDDTHEISEYALQSVRNLRRIGLMNGIGENIFAPKQNVTRAQAAKAIYELMMRLQ